MFCQNCGQEIGTARFCPNCGAQVQNRISTGSLVIRKANLNTLAGNNIGVYVDSQFETSLGNNNRITLALPAGDHEIRLQIDDYADAFARVRIDPNITSTYVLEVDNYNKMTQLTKWEEPHTVVPGPVQSSPSVVTRQRRSGGMVCKRCGSDNVNVQIIQENRGGTTVTKTKGSIKEKGHGLLWWLFIGWWWKIIDLFLWVFLFSYRFFIWLIGSILFPKRRKYKTESTSVSTTTNKIVYKKICTCQSCGNSWRI